MRASRSTSMSRRARAASCACPGRRVPRRTESLRLKGDAHGVRQHALPRRRGEGRGDRPLRRQRSPRRSRRPALLPRARLPRHAAAERADPRCAVRAARLGAGIDVGIESGAAAPTLVIVSAETDAGERPPAAGLRARRRDGARRGRRAGAGRDAGRTGGHPGLGRRGSGRRERRHARRDRLRPSALRPAGRRPVQRLHQDPFLEVSPDQARRAR